jgi:hypothetical protein
MFFHAKIYFTQRFISREDYFTQRPPAAASQRSKERKGIQIFKVQKAAVKQR